MGRRHRPQTWDRWQGPEDGEDLPALVSSRGREQPTVTGAVVRLPNWLRPWPLATGRPKLIDPVRRKDARSRKIRDVLNVRRDLPRFSRHPIRGRDAQLRSVAVPLGPSGGLSVGQVVGADNRPSLPAAVVGVRRPEERIVARAIDPPPDAADRNPGGGQAAQEKESFSSSATSFETSLYRPSPSATSGGSSPNATIGLLSQSGTYEGSIV